MRFERRMSDAEALMWSLDSYPGLRSTFLNVTIVDRAPDFARFRQRMERAVYEIPRLRQRVVAAPAGLGTPEWVDDPSFDLDFHVRRVALPAPATDRDLLDTAALDFQDPFDRARPLWRFTIVEGIEGGRAALLAKMHHTITDGVGGVRLSAMFIELERDAPPPAEVPRDHDPSTASAPPPAGAAEAVVRTLTGLAQSRGRAVATAATTIARTVANPLRLVPAATASAAAAPAIASSIARQALVLDPARSPLWAGRRSLGRRFEVVTVPLEPLKVKANALGGTINDAFVSCVAGGAGRYHAEKGVEVDELRAAMAVSTREDKSAGGNSFVPTRVLLPVDADDPVGRFLAVRDRLAATRKERAVSVAGALAGVLQTLPAWAVVSFARQQAETVDFATSNVRGAPWDLFIAGAEILHNHPMGPTAGSAFNATVMSYRGQLDVGLNIDTAAVDDPALLRDCIEDAFHEFLALET